MTQQTALTQLTTAQARNKSAGGPFIGAIIGWRISNDVRIEHEALSDAAASYGIPANYLPAPVKPAKAFRKAIEKTRSSAKDAGLLLRYIGSSPKDEDEKIVVGLVEETADLKAEDLKYAQKGVINYSAGNITDTISSLYPELAETLNEQYQFYQEHTADDIRKVLLNFTSECAARLTLAGGSYFVPATKNSIFNAIRSFISEVVQDTDSQIFTFEIYDSPQNQSDLGKVAVDNLESEIKELADNLESFLTEAKRVGAKFENGLANRMLQVTQLEARVHAFGSVLKFQSDFLYGSLTAIKDSIDQKETHQQNIKEKVEGMSQPRQEKYSSNDKRELLKASIA